MANNRATNILTQGAGVYLHQIQDSTIRVVNCTVVNNLCGENSFGAGGLSMRNDMVNYPNSAYEVFDCIFYSNRVGAVVTNWGSNGTNVVMRFAHNCSIPTMNGLNGGGANNITNYPMFVNPTNDEYQLLKDSPCINTGTNHAWMTSALDLDGHARLDIHRRIVDMGAYEYVYQGMILSTK